MKQGKRFASLEEMIGLREGLLAVRARICKNDKNRPSLSMLYFNIVSDSLNIKRQKRFRKEIKTNKLVRFAEFYSNHNSENVDVLDIALLLYKQAELSTRTHYRLTATR